MKKTLDNLMAERDTFDKESQVILDSIVFVKKELGAIESMKRSEGWKIMDKKIREELKNRIADMVKDDLKIQTLLALLKVADTKSMRKTLEAEIEGILPE